MAAKPVVLPEPFSGETSWDEWSIHFGNVADVNEWDDEQKLKWLKVRLTGRAQKAFQHLPEASRATFNLAKAALKMRFEPESRTTRYQAEFQSRRKKTSEGWADFADDLQSLAEKAYPSLQHEARERLAINAYLQQLTQPQVAFSVKQRNPETLDDAVAATLEMESYVESPHNRAGAVSTLQPETEAAIVAVIGPVEKLTRMVERLTEQVETLQEEASRARCQPADEGRDRHPRYREGRQEPGNRRPKQQSRTFDGEYWRCHERGHIARNCTQSRRAPQTGKLETPGAQGRAPEGEPSKAHSPNVCVCVSPVAPKGGYRLLGAVNDVQLSLLLDT